MSTDTDDSDDYDDSDDSDDESKEYDTLTNDTDDDRATDPDSPDPDSPDPDSPEAVWDDVDPVEAGAASTEFEEKTLSNGKPVVAKDLTEGDIERYRDRVESRHRDLSDEEIGQRAIMIALVEHYDTPSFSGLTFEKYKQGRLGYYNKFLEAIAPEIAARRRGN
jgi:hypothetical protein